MSFRARYRDASTISLLRGIQLRSGSAPYISVVAMASQTPSYVCGLRAGCQPVCGARDAEAVSQIVHSVQAENLQYTDRQQLPSPPRRMRLRRAASRVWYYNKGRPTTKGYRITPAAAASYHLCTPSPLSASAIDRRFHSRAHITFRRSSNRFEQVLADQRRTPSASAS
jgi:hypothetical protein